MWWLRSASWYRFICITTLQMLWEHPQMNAVNVIYSISRVFLKLESERFWCWITSPRDKQGLRVTRGEKFYSVNAVQAQHSFKGEHTCLRWLYHRPPGECEEVGLLYKTVKIESNTMTTQQQEGEKRYDPGDTTLKFVNRQDDLDRKQSI